MKTVTIHLYHSLESCYLGIGVKWMRMARDVAIDTLLDLCGSLYIHILIEAYFLHQRIPLTLSCTGVHSPTMSSFVQQPPVFCMQWTQKQLSSCVITSYTFPAPLTACTAMVPVTSLTSLSGRVLSMSPDCTNLNVLCASSYSFWRERYTPCPTSLVPHHHKDCPK